MDDGTEHTDPKIRHSGTSIEQFCDDQSPAHTRDMRKLSDMPYLWNLPYEEKAPEQPKTPAYSAIRLQLMVPFDKSENFQSTSDVSPLLETRSV
jgi:hypothetical protein